MVCKVNAWATQATHEAGVGRVFAGSWPTSPLHAQGGTHLIRDGSAACGGQFLLSEVVLVNGPAAH